MTNINITTNVSEQDSCCNLLHLDESEQRDLMNILPSEQTVNDLSLLFKMFGDSTRIKIMLLLAQKELCVCDIATTLNMSQSAVSHQLKTLKTSRLVRFRRSGKTIFYSLNDGHIHGILAQGLDHVNE